MPNLLEQLKQRSIVVADTGDISAIQQFSPQDATTNPSLILKAVQSGQYDDLIDATLERVLSESVIETDMIESASDELIVAMGCIILQHVPGRVSTEVNARLSFDQEGSIEKARKLIALYEKAGIPRQRILIKLAATWEGIRAAEILEKEGIQCNLTLIFSFVQGRACAEAGVYLISPFVGRILDWYRKQTPDTAFSPEQEPGVLSVRKIYEYFRRQEYPTIVMGSSFRNTGEILALAGCDRLTVSPALLQELTESDGKLEQALVPINPDGHRPDPLSESEFRWLMNEDAMATEKLAEGIRGVEQDQVRLETLLKERISQREPVL
ncbi:transaldolase [Hahella ganghwensis]|uniref:transaldolase n=1 Tax=Hahella ganghwensis TaxID=286420 RepID=UPI000360BDEF|nr:transaldolase [Hahella ganghwensis]